MDGFIVRTVSSGTHGPNCPHRHIRGTFALTRSDAEDFRGLVRYRGGFVRSYGYLPRSAAFGTTVLPDGQVVATHYRWTWEGVTPDGHRFSDMIIASRVPQ
jgi:hypothetical protein